MRATSARSSWPTGSAAFKPLRAVSGNIDGGMTRRVYPAFQVFECERVQVLMTHIGGYPRHYDPRAVQKIQSVHPKLFIARAFPHPQSHLRSRLRPAPRQPRSRRGVRLPQGPHGPYALRSTARRCATWRSASGPAAENPAGGELKPTVRESLFRHEITRNKILYPKRPKMHSGRISVIVSEISETFRQVAS